MRAYSPTGSPILGSYEMCPARAEILPNSFERDPATGELTYDHAGGSEMFWDAMETVTRNGKVVFLDEDGEEWTEDQIELREEKEED
jgi:hypothetical protein